MVVSWWIVSFFPSEGLYIFSKEAHQADKQTNNAAPMK